MLTRKDYFIKLSTEFECLLSNPLLSKYNVCYRLIVAKVKYIVMMCIKFRRMRYCAQCKVRVYVSSR